ncbi:MAG: hypothetical protein ACJ741_16335 [Pyrinomonadaceae bacterium]
MAEPIILDGGAQMVKIKLPTAYKKNAEERGEFSVTSEPNIAPFQRIVVSNPKTGKEVFSLPLDDKTLWKIEIK